MLLAYAGVRRLGWTHLIGETIEATVILPAVGQGALGIEIREGDERVRDFVSPLHHAQTAIPVLAERALLRRLEGGCQVPIGAFGRSGGSQGLLLDAMVGSLNGWKIVRNHIEGRPQDTESLGVKLAERLLASGAEEILKQIRGASAATVDV
jgi:hydroxymethylbilane synthase